MKLFSKLNLLVGAALVLLILPSCSTVEDPTSGNQETGLVNRAVIGTVQDGDAELSVDPAELRIAFREAYETENADDFSIQKGTENYFLVGMLINADQTRTTFAVELDLSNDGDLGFDPTASTQSCTTKSNCKGCKLNVIDSTSGWCDCAKDTNIGTEGSCTHKVTVEVPSIAGENKKDYDEVALGMVIDYLNR